MSDMLNDIKVAKDKADASRMEAEKWETAWDKKRFEALEILGLRKLRISTFIHKMLPYKETRDSLRRFFRRFLIAVGIIVFILMLVAFFAPMLAIGVGAAVLLFAFVIAFAAFGSALGYVPGSPY